MDNIQSSEVFKSIILSSCIQKSFIAQFYAFNLILFHICIFREPCNRRYRADSLVSPPPGFPRNSRMFVYGPSLEVITPSSTDLGERSDTLSSPRVSPLPWLGQHQHSGAVHGSVPELVITSPSGEYSHIHILQLFCNYFLFLWAHAHTHIMI